MKKKLLTSLLAAALCIPQVAFAARDGEGMEYTSASEGFYGSIRTVYRTKAGADKNNGGIIAADGSRLGLRGTLDLGSGLTGLYRYEWSISGDNGSPTGNTRLSYVGLRGANWGEVVFGSHWENDYNWVTAATDIATTGSGNFAPHFRRKNSAQYTTPDINGFQGSFRFTADGGDKQATMVTAVVATDDNPPTPTVRVTPVDPSENVDEWAVAAKYSTHGFTFGGAYEVVPDGTRTDTKTEDNTFWALRLGYGQDNWALNGWYGEHNDSDRNSDHKDRKIFSVAGNIDLGKYALVAIYETQDDTAAMEDTVFIVNGDYKFTSRSKAYIAYIANDFDTNADKEDELRIGLRMDF